MSPQANRTQLREGLHLLKLLLGLEMELRNANQPSLGIASTRRYRKHCDISLINTDVAFCAPKWFSTPKGSELAALQYLSQQRPSRAQPPISAHQVHHPLPVDIPAGAMMGTWARPWPQPPPLHPQCYRGWFGADPTTSTPILTRAHHRDPHLLPGGFPSNSPCRPAESAE